MYLRLATALLLPSLVLQGYRVKKKTPRLAEPVGERCGKIGQGPLLSLLIMGDSAAAGVGVAHQQQALLGQVLALLSPHYEVDYQLYAHSGDTSRDLMRRLATYPPRQFDVVISSIGVNDVTRLMGAKQWIQQQQQLYQLVQRQFQPRLILAAGVPPMQQFPALPQPMAWLLGKYAQAMNRALAQFAGQQPDFDWIEYDLAAYQALQLEMAADGFHPSQEIYQFWAQALVEKMQQHLNLCINTEMQNVNFQSKTTHQASKDS